MTPTDIIVAVVALYGAVLSTIIAIREWKARSPNIKVSLSMGFLTYRLGGVSERMVFIEASNPGHKAVTLKSVGLVLPNLVNLVLPNPQSNVTFPHELLPEKSCNVWREAGQLEAQLKAMGFSEKVNIIGFYQDEVGRTHESKPFEVRLENNP